jgi:hypothetical protein
MKDIKLSYSGGSGGFLLLYLLLLSGKFYTSFDKITLNGVIDSQWNITNHNKWKESETWPNNEITQLTTTSLRKLYFSCNPDDDKNLTIFPGKNLIVYTDIDSQIELAYFKKANPHWFLGDTSNASFTLRKIQVFREKLLEWNIHYNNIKDPTWPKCLSFRHINRLPIAIQQELLESEYTQQFLNQGFRPFLYNYYKNELVYSPILPFLNSADIVVKLQDVVNSNGKILEDLMEIPTMNNEQHKLIERWKKLHPQELLEKIGITP